MGRPRKLRDEGNTAVLEAPQVPVNEKPVRYPKYEGPESLPPYDEKMSNTFKYSRFFVTGYKNSTMKLIRVFRGAPTFNEKTGKMASGPIKHSLVRAFKPSNEHKPADKALYEILKKSGLVV